MTQPTDINLTRAETLKSRALPYFAAAALIWVGVSAFLCLKFCPPHEPIKRALTWFAILGGICLLDLFALAQALAGLFDLMQDGSSKPIFLIIRTSYWGGIKLVCVIFLGFLMVRGSSVAGSSGIPTVGLLTGVSTLVVVPLLGFLFWFKGFKS